MTTTYLSQLRLPFEKSDQDQDHLPTFSEITKTSSPPCPVFCSSPQDQIPTAATCRDHYQQQKEEPSNLWLMSAPTDVLLSSTTNINSHGVIIQEQSHDQHCGQDMHESSKWMSSKMRWMRKMAASDNLVASKPGRCNQAAQDQQLFHNQDNSRNNSSSPGGVIRVCSNCNTTKTPLWRSGPQGPKSLCNACGIRQRKARRAMAAAAAAAASVSGGLIPIERPGKVQKVKKLDRNCTLPYKKRYTLPLKKRRKIVDTGTSQKKLHFDDIVINLGNNADLHQVFPQDERDAAVLLMALSCSLIHD